MTKLHDCCWAPCLRWAERPRQQAGIGRSIASFRLDQAKSLASRWMGQVQVPVKAGGGGDTSVLSQHSAEEVRLVTATYFFRPARGSVCNATGHAPSARSRGLLVFFHGLGCSKLDFVGALSRFPEYDVLSLDWPTVEDGEDDITHSVLPAFQHYVAFAHSAIGAVLHASGLKHPDPGTPLILIGHSMGGKLATLYAHTFPGEVAVLIQVEGHLHSQDPRMAKAMLQECGDSSFDDYTKELLARSKGTDDLAAEKWAKSIRGHAGQGGFLAQLRVVRAEQRGERRCWAKLVHVWRKERAEGGWLARHIQCSWDSVRLHTELWPLPVCRQPGCLLDSSS
eukprot:TRINITY_DN25371_c0_g1_i1.p1 TRINITY_DN25371_c0_g1~~TRINITY_DN25371_c0_g1_i1.p1  ORF type:complete len:338 (-),score=22.46 TRINITY_DN25371_c0_g1_i1:680-1693(-)